MTTFQKAIVAIGASMCVGAIPAYAQSAAPANDDFAKRSSEIHWPAGYAPKDADLFAHNELSINASCGTVWKHIVEATKWPEWYPNAHDVKITNNQTGLLQLNSQFQWSTFGHQVESQIHEFVPTSRVGWFGKAPDINAYHTWFLAPAANDGCQVVTEEVVKGPGAIKVRNADPNRMHKGHDLWLAKLKLVSEKRT